MKIFGREGADRRTEGRFYLAVVQAVILFGSEKWVMTPQTEKALKGLHHRAVRRMSGMVTKHQRDGTWVYPSIGTALATMGLNEIRVYISCYQNKVA